jgi:hypothetical protein
MTSQTLFHPLGTGPKRFEADGVTGGAYIRNISFVTARMA